MLVNRARKFITLRQKKRQAIRDTKVDNKKKKKLRALLSQHTMQLLQSKGIFPNGEPEAVTDKKEEAAVENVEVELLELLKKNSLELKKPKIV